MNTHLQNTQVCTVCSVVRATSCPPTYLKCYLVTSVVLDVSPSMTCSFEAGLTALRARSLFLFEVFFNMAVETVRKLSSGMAATDTVLFPRLLFKPVLN